MIKVSVLYPNEEGSHFDMNYYVDQHIAMIRGLVGDALRKVEVDQGLSGPAPDSRAPFVAAVHMYFDSVPAFYESFGPHAGTVKKDVLNYTNIRPVTQISAVRDPATQGGRA